MSCDLRLIAGAFTDGQVEAVHHDSHEPGCPSRITFHGAASLLIAKSCVVIRCARSMPLLGHMIDSSLRKEVETT